MCRQVRELLSLYAEGELDSAREALVAEHLAGCPACRERMELDRELAAQLAAFTPAEGLAARRTALRVKVMAQVEKERRWQPWRRAALQFGNAAAWVTMSLVTGLLLLAIAVTWRPLAEKAWRGQAPAGTPAPAGIGWHVVKDEMIADYYWVVDGERVDRTPQLSPDGSKIAYLPTVDGQATDIDRLVVRDLETGKDLDLTPEEGYSYTSVRWSPDSKTLAFVKYRGDVSYPTLSELWRVDADGGNLTRLYAAQHDGVAETRGRGLVVDGWSADGRYIDVQVTALLSSYMGRRRVRADGSGSEEQAYPTAADMGAEEGAPVGREVFSPAGGFFLHAVKTAGLLEKPEGAPADGQSLVLYDFASKRSTILGSFPDAIQLTDGDVSPDGEWISFVTVASVEGEGAWQPGTLWVVRRDGTGLREVMLNGEPAPADMPGPLWAAGGRAYYNQPPWVSAIWICELDAASGDADLITHKFPARDLVSVSRDGRRLLIVRGAWENAQLCLLTLAPKPAPTPTATAEPAAPAPEFGAPRDLFTPPPSAGFYRVSPDGQWVLFPVPGGRTAMGDLPPHLEADSIADGQMQTIALFAAEADLAGEGQYTWFPDSRRVLVTTSGEGGQMLTIGLDQAAQTLARAPQGSAGFGEAAVSPDGQHIAYTVLYPDGSAPVPKIGLEVMNADGSGRRQIEAPDYFIGRLAWSTGPGGSNLTYFKGQGGTPPEGGEMYEVGVGVGAAPAEPGPVAEGMRAVAWSPSTPGNTWALWLSEPADAQGKADLYLSAWPVSGAPQIVAKGVSAAGAAWAGSDHWFVYSQDGALYLAENGGRERLVRLTPEDETAGAPVWVPGMGLVYEAVRDGRAVLRLLPLKEGTPEPSEQDTAGLTVEEHDVTTVGTGFANNEGTEWIGPEILDVRRAWREPAPAEQVVATNEALRPFGLRLEPKEKPGWSQPFYDLYKGDRLVLGDLDTVWPASVSAAGDDFALLVEQLNGGYYLVRATGSEKWDGSQQQGQPPVFVGRDLVTVTGIAELRNVTVMRGSLPAYTSFFVDWPPASYPVKGLWSWQGHWVLEVSGRLVIDGEDLNRELGYDEIFGYRLIKGQPFYFFKQDGRVGVSYDGVTLPQQYDEVRHYGCCSAAAYNPGGNDTMTWFFGRRDGTWYYVEMGRYGAEEAPTSAGGWEATVELQPLDASGGALYGRLVLTNCSQEARTLEGRPQVAIIDGNGETVPTAVGEGWDAGPPVTVRPGEQAVARIMWANYCGQAPAEPLSLQLVLPGPEAVQLSVPLKLVGGLPRCNVEAPASSLTVGSFELAEAPPAVTPTPGAAQAAFSTFLPAATAYLESPMQSPEAISAEAIIARDLQALMREHGLAPLYVQRSQGEREAWVGAGVAGSETGAFLLWRQGDRVAYQFYSGEYAYFLYLVNPPQALRLVERDGALEMGLITAPSGSTGDIWFLLLRLTDGKWAEVWSPSQAPSDSWQSGAPSSVEFTGPEIDSLRLVGPIPGDVPASRVFFEFGVYLKQSYESAWQRQGDGYVRVSGKILPTPLTALADFIAALQKGDRAGATALATEPGVVDAALALGLDEPASGEGWLATQEVVRAGGAERIRFFDSDKRDRSYAATLAQEGGEWRVSGIERIAGDATPTPQQGPGAIKALHMVNSQIGWAEAERGILRTTDGGASWEEAMPWWREGESSKPASSPLIAGTFFLDAQHAWAAWGPAAGTRLTVEYTADGGRNWQSSLLPAEGVGAQFSFVDARRGWLLLHQGAAAGSEGVAVLGTLDGGATWKVLSASDPQNPQPGQVPFAGNKRGIAFADAANGWLTLFEPVDGKVFLYATHDGGHTWAEQALTLPDGYEETQPSPEAPVFFSAQEGVLAVNAWREGPSRLFYITHDGGATWSAAAPVDAAVNGSVVSDFISVDEGWALVQPVPGGSGGVELRHTADGGRTWAALTTDPALAGMLALDFVDARTGWALCTGEESTYLLRTTDGGRTWARMP